MRAEAPLHSPFSDMAFNAAPGHTGADRGALIAAARRIQLKILPIGSAVFGPPVMPRRNFTPVRAVFRKVCDNKYTKGAPQEDDA